MLSKISFSIKKAQLWNNQLSQYSNEATRHADVYVFCLLKHDVRETIDPLNLDHWDFYIVPITRLNSYQRSEHSITLKSLQALTSAVNYGDIKSAFQSAYEIDGI